MQNREQPDKKRDRNITLFHRTQNTNRTKWKRQALSVIDINVIRFVDLYWM
jgi:hypothetical protein